MFLFDQPDRYHGHGAAKNGIGQVVADADGAYANVPGEHFSQRGRDGGHVSRGYDGQTDLPGQDHRLVVVMHQPEKWVTEQDDRYGPGDDQPFAADAIGHISKSYDGDHEYEKAHGIQAQCQRTGLLHIVDQPGHHEYK